jgi:hypothetical protein
VTLFPYSPTPAPFSFHSNGEFAESKLGFFLVQVFLTQEKSAGEGI